MESYFSSKSTSESNLWDLEKNSWNSVNLEDMLLDGKQEEDVQCRVCKKRKETLARREEVAWQREDVIHTREKELREWELMLEEKNKLLIEKEKRLKDKEENVWKREAVYNSKESSRKSSISEIGLRTFTLECAKDRLKNAFVLEKEELLHEKEKVITEKIRNIERKEKSILLKEQQLNNEKITANKEREFVAERKHDMESREEAVRKLEEALERKLKVIYEEKKSLSDREKLLTQKENVLSTARDILLNKERVLQERENIIIEKERSVIEQINELTKPIETECAGKLNAFLKEFNEIFDDRWNSLQQRGAIVNHSELILQEKWKDYSEANKVLKSQEESLSAMNDTFSKEKIILREWEKLLQKQEDDIVEKHKLIEATQVKTSKGVPSDKTTNSSYSPLDTQCEMDIQKNGNYLSCTSGQQLMSNGESNLKISDTDENVDLCNETHQSEYREISGDELFQIYENEKTLMQENLAEISTKEQEDNAGKNTEDIKELTGSVQAFFGIMNEKTSQSQLMIVEKRNEVLMQENNQSSAIAPDSKTNCATYLEDAFTKETSSASSECTILSERSYRESDKKDNAISLHSSGHERETTVKIVGEKSNSGISTSKDEIQGSNNNTSQIATESAIFPPKEEESQSLGCNITADKGKKNKTDEGEKNKTEDDSCYKNNIDSRSSKVSHTSPLPSAASTRSVTSPVSRTSPLSSASSARSLTSPISGRSSPWVGKKQRKPSKDALLKAICERNSLETVQLMDTNCMSMEVRNDEGRTAVLLAVEWGNKPLVERLIHKGAEIKASDYKGSSALHIAVAENNIDMVLFLLEKGLDPRVTDINGNSSLQLALNLQYSSLTEIIKKHINVKYPSV